jgi:hypothetical protein
MKTCPKCGDARITSVSYGHGEPCRYDGVSEHRCEGCGYRQGRWTGQELKDGEHEPRHGGAHDKGCRQRVELPVAKVVSHGR